MNLQRLAYLFGFVFVAIMLLLSLILYWIAPHAPDAKIADYLSRIIFALVGTSAVGAVVLLSALGATVVIKMATGTIDLKHLVADEVGAASLSRFQMLLFTFVIASLYFLYSLHSLVSGASASLPEIPGSVLGLLGISGGSYLLSKGINAASGAGGPAPAAGDATSVRMNNK
ncbi:MAG: hypothetical protein ACKOEC_04535 [Acidimicrobiia bacterium]